jgi:hypothetical protein
MAKIQRCFHWYGVSGYIVAAGTGADINDKYFSAFLTGFGFKLDCFR